MTNIDRATLVINETYADEWVKLHMTPPKVAQALADATPPLLMPDLPEPDNGYPEWLVGGFSISPGLNAGEVDIEWEDRILRLAPGQVLALLAAFTYAERNQE